MRLQLLQPRLGATSAEMQLLFQAAVGREIGAWGRASSISAFTQLMPPLTKQPLMQHHLQTTVIHKDYASHGSASVWFVGHTLTFPEAPPSGQVYRCDPRMKNWTVRMFAVFDSEPSHVEMTMTCRALNAAQFAGQLGFSSSFCYLCLLIETLRRQKDGRIKINLVCGQRWSQS